MMALGLLAPLVLAANDPTVLLSVRTIPAAPPIAADQAIVTLGPGGVVFTTGFVLENVAVLDAPALIGGATVPAGFAFERGRVSAANRNPWLAQVDFACAFSVGENKAAVKPALDSVARQSNARSGTPVLLCLADEDRDRRFESAFVIDTQFQVMGAPVAIPPVAYAIQPTLPINDDTGVTIRYRGKCTFQIDAVNFPGTRRPEGFRTLYTVMLDEHRTVSNARFADGNCGALPAAFEMAGTRFEVIARGSGADTVTVRRIAGFARSLIGFDYPPVQIILNR